MENPDYPADQPDSNESASARTLHRALIAHGSVTRLAAALDATVEDLLLWMEGKAVPPHEVFLRALELAFARGQGKLSSVKDVVQKYYSRK